MQGMRGLMRSEGISATYFMPGFVDTDMSRRYAGPRPFVITADRAAQIIKKHVGRRTAELVFPAPLKLLSPLLYSLPVKLADKIVLSRPFGVRPE